LSRKTAAVEVNIRYKSPLPSKETPTSTKGPDEETTKHSTVPVVQYSRPKREVKTPKYLSDYVRY